MVGPAPKHSRAFDACLRRSPRRLGFEPVGADARRLFYIRRKDSNETPDLLDLDLAGVEAWVREYVQAI